MENILNMKNINLSIEELNLNIKKIIEEANLPIGVVYYIFKNIFNEIEKMYYANLNSVILKQQQQQNKEVSNSSQGQAN